MKQATINIANLVTLSRILLIPAILGVYLYPLQVSVSVPDSIFEDIAVEGSAVSDWLSSILPLLGGTLGGIIPLSHLLAALLFIIASISDGLDGYLARRLGQTSDFGAFLDPIADKLLVVCVLILLVSAHAGTATPAGDATGLLLPAVVIIAREVAVLALREWMASRGLRGRVAVSFSGKLKTGVQMTAISALLLASASAPPLLWQLGYWLLLLSAALSLWSMVRYFIKAQKGEISA